MSEAPDTSDFKPPGPLRSSTARRSALAANTFFYIGAIALSFAVFCSYALRRSLEVEVLESASWVAGLEDNNSVQRERIAKVKTGLTTVALFIQTRVNDRANDAGTLRYLLQDATGMLADLPSGNDLRESPPDHPRSNAVLLASDAKLSLSLRRTYLAERAWLASRERTALDFQMQTLAQQHRRIESAINAVYKALDDTPPERLPGRLWLDLGVATDDILADRSRQNRGRSSGDSWPLERPLPSPSGSLLRREPGVP